MIPRQSLLAALALAALFTTPLAAETIPPAISVTGEATMSVAPDLVTIDVGVSSEAKTAREASEANNTAMTKVLTALKGTGIEEKDYRTSRLSLQPRYAPNRGVSSPIVGFSAANRLMIRLHDISKLAGMIDTLVGAGANEIGNISFSVSQTSRILDDARERAVADARRKAEIYAKAAGVTLGAPLSISEAGSYTPVFRANTVAAPAPPPPIAQGEETLTITISASWAIKQTP